MALVALAWRTETAAWKAFHSSHRPIGEAVAGGAFHSCLLQKRSTQKCHLDCDHGHEAAELGSVSGSELFQWASQHR